MDARVAGGHAREALGVSATEGRRDHHAGPPFGAASSRPERGCGFTSATALALSGQPLASHPVDVLPGLAPSAPHPPPVGPMLEHLPARDAVHREPV